MFFFKKKSISKLQLQEQAMLYSILMTAAYFRATMHQDPTLGLLFSKGLNMYSCNETELLWIEYFLHH